MSSGWLLRVGLLQAFVVSVAERGLAGTYPWKKATGICPWMGFGREGRGALGDGLDRSGTDFK